MASKLAKTEVPNHMSTWNVYKVTDYALCSLKKGILIEVTKRQVKMHHFTCMYIQVSFHNTNPHPCPHNFKTFPPLHTQNGKDILILIPIQYKTFNTLTQSILPHEPNKAK